jgi:hypothetical protein
MSNTTTALAANVLRTRPTWLVSVLAGVTAAAVTEIYGLAARAAGIPMAAGSIGATTAEPITVGVFAMGTLICTFWGTVLAVILARYATRPAPTYVWTTVTLTAVSLTGPLAAGDTLRCPEPSGQRRRPGQATLGLQTHPPWSPADSFMSTPRWHGVAEYSAPTR